MVDGFFIGLFFLSCPCLNNIRHITDIISCSIKLCVKGCYIAYAILNIIAARPLGILSCKAFSQLTEGIAIIIFKLVIKIVILLGKLCCCIYTIKRLLCSESSEEHLQVIPRIVFLTLGTNHVYRLKETGGIVDNCEKRPASLFQEEALTVSQCTEYLRKTVELLKSHNPEVQVILTVSPIRYRKYGYHESQLSKATLLLAASQTCQTIYFPAYEILVDELRDYRFYAADMLHPSEQAIDYIWERLNNWCFSPEAISFMEEWRPIRQALSHRPFHPESEEYQRFKVQTQTRLKALQNKYPNFIYNKED